MRNPGNTVQRLACALVLAAAAGCGSSYQFQPVSLGDDPRGPHAPRPRTDGQFVRALYTDVVGRTPQVYDFVVRGPDGQELYRFPIDEQATLVAFFDEVGDPAPLRALLAAGLAAADEARLPRKEEVAAPESFIADQFRRLLGREPGTYELYAFVKEWRRDPAVNPRTVVRSIVSSREYQSF